MESAPPTSGQAIAGPATAGAGAMPSAVPLFHAAWLFAIGIAATEGLWLRPPLVLVALAPVAVLCGVAAFRAQRIVWLPMAVLWLLLGAWCAEMEPHPAPPPALAALSDGLLRTVEGTVIDAGPINGEPDQNPEPGDASQGQRPTQRLSIRVSSLEVVTDSDDAQAPVEGGVRLTVHWPSNPPGPAVRPFQCGERIRAVARLLPPEDLSRPGDLEPRGFSGRPGHHLHRPRSASTEWTAWAMPPACSSPAASAACSTPSSARLLALPAAMRRLPAPLRLSQDDAIMLAAMVTGDRTYLTHSLRVGFERTGSFHMLVVSGFHLAIVAGCIFWLARRLRLPRVPATLVTILASFAYALFTGFATPVAALALDGHPLPARPAASIASATR